MILEHELDAELKTKPVLKIGDEEHRRRGIHAQSGKFRLGIDALGRELQALGKIRHSPITDLGLGRIRFHGGARVDRLAWRVS